MTHQEYHPYQSYGSRIPSSIDEAVPVGSIPSYDVSSERKSDRLLDLLSLIKYRDISIFSVRPSVRANISRGIGRGASGEVELRGIPYGAQVARSRFQSIKASVILRKDESTDHAGRHWRLDTQVAQKINKKDDASFEQCLEEVTREAAILTHPFLSTHPNLVRLLGINWTHSSFQPSQVRPSILTEAAQSDLLRLLQDRANSNAPLSFDVKFRLALDVLRGLKALHSCNIVHGDIKCENVLVYKSDERGNAENFIARIADLSGCLYLRDSPRLQRSTFTRTELYSPPEVSQWSNLNTIEDAKKIDSWGWGMLLWQLMLGQSLFDYFKAGDDYESLETIVARRARMEGPTALKHEAARSVRSHLNEGSRLAPATIDLICELLVNALTREPHERASVERLEQEMTSQSEVPIRFDRQPDSSIQHRLLEDLLLERLPAFDICKFWDELIPHPSLCVTLVDRLKELSNEQLSESSGDIRTSSAFQLALCYCSGLGCNDVFESQRDGRRLLLELAIEGHLKAQILAFRIAEGVRGLEELYITRSQVTTWLKRGLLSRSRVAREDLYLLDHEAYAETVREAEERDVFSRPEAVTASERLLLSCKNGAFKTAMHILDSGEDVDVNLRDSEGATAAHWLVNTMDDREALTLLRRLTERDADLWLTADLSCMYSSFDCMTELSFPQSTPFVWAIAANRACLVRQMLELANIANQIASNSIVCAIRHQSVECLEEICHHVQKQQIRQSLSTKSIWGINHLDEWNNHPLFYAIRNDELTGLLRCQPRVHRSPGRSQVTQLQTTETMIFGSRTDETIKILLRQEPDLWISSHPLNRWNVFHQAAAVGHPLLLDVLLKEIRPGSDILEEGLQGRKPGSDEPVQGPSPLAVAAHFGNVAGIRLLIDAGANRFAVHKLSGETILHALCYCFIPARSEAAVTYVLDRFPELQTMKDHSRNLPVHTASWVGNTTVLKALLKTLDGRCNTATKSVRGSFSMSDALVATNDCSITPLGCAIAGKSLSAVQELLKYHVSTKRSLTAAILDSGCRTRRRLSAFRFLLNPGRWSDMKVHMMGVSGETQRGCLDLPFSGTSMDILDNLLVARGRFVESKTRDKFIEDWTFNTNKTPNSLSGLSEAVAICENKAVEKLCCPLFTPLDYRRLLRVAFLQLAVEDKVHIASRLARQQMVEFLRTEDERQWRSLRQERTGAHAISGALWKVWYLIYGDVLREQELLFDRWRVDHPDRVGVPSLEFGPTLEPRTFWSDPRKVISFGICWIIMLAYFVSLALFNVRHPGAAHPSKAVSIVLSLLAVVLFALVTMLPQILKISTIYLYRALLHTSSAQEYPVDKPVIKYFQLIVCLLSIIAQGVIDWILLQMAYWHGPDTDGTLAFVFGIIFTSISFSVVVGIELVYIVQLVGYARELKKSNRFFKWTPSDFQVTQIMQGHKTIAIASWWYAQF